jgi:hypothetical protein
MYNNYDREPYYINKKGRIIDFKRVPLLNKLRNKLPLYFNEKAPDSFVESNKYYNLKKHILVCMLMLREI